MGWQNGRIGSKQGRQSLALGLVLAGLSAGPAAAVNENIYQAIAGPWLLADEATNDACVVTLSSTIEAGVHRLQGAAGCHGRLAAVAGALMWDLDAQGGLTLRASNRKPLLRLNEDADGQYFEPGDPGRRRVLMAANEGSERLVRLTEMPGKWVFARPDGTPVCPVTFLARKVAADSGFRGLIVAPTCDAGLRKLQLVKWHVEGALLVLVGAETADLTLVPKADGTFVKSAKEGGRPLVLRSIEN
jgi:hypothetical protein